MFSVTGGVAALLELLELLEPLPAAEPVAAAFCVMLGNIFNFLPLPARRRGLSNR
jgi:hypothetical protein